MMFLKKPMIRHPDPRSDAHRDDHQIRHLPLQRQQTRQLFNARSAPARPEIQHHHLPAQLAQVHRSASHRSRTNCGAGLPRFSGWLSAVASRHQQASPSTTLAHSSTHRYTPLPIIRTREQYRPARAKLEIVRTAPVRTLRHHPRAQRSSAPSPPASPRCSPSPNPGSPSASSGS